MIDFLIFSIMVLTVSWSVSLTLSLLSRFHNSRQILSKLLGGARGAVALPPIFGFVVAGLLYASHRNWIRPFLVNDPIYDEHGCIHKFIHQAAASPIVFISIVLVLAALLCAGPVVHGIRKRNLKKSIRSGVDRDLTRAVRAQIQQIPGAISGEFVWVSRSAERNGPFSMPVGGRNCIFLPPTILQHLEDLRAVLQHERSHFTRKHFLRRWVFEVLFATLIPRFLMHSWLDAAREEEEFQADDLAVEIVGSSAMVARALLRSAERVVASGARCVATGQMLQDGDLEFRVKRLFDANRVRPRRLWTTVSTNLAIALAACSVLATNPDAGLIAFCAFERLLGISCS